MFASGLAGSIGARSTTTQARPVRQLIDREEDLRGGLLKQMNQRGAPIDGISAGSLEEEDELLVELDEVAAIGRSQFTSAGQLVMATWAPLAEQYQV